MSASRHVIGGEKFAEETERRLAIRRSGSGATGIGPAAIDGPHRTIDETVAAHYSVLPADLGSCQAGGGAAKFVAVELACRLTGMTQRAIVPHYGAISSAGVSNIRRRLRTGEYALRVVAKLTDDLASVSS